MLQLQRWSAAQDIEVAENAIFGKSAHEAGSYVTNASSSALSFRFNLATWHR